MWKKRIDEVNDGKAVISVREWSDKPYKSVQQRLFTLGMDGVGYQKIEFKYDCIYYPIIDKNLMSTRYSELAKNDGLSEDDFNDWFKGYDATEPMIIIHFTKFRY